MKIGQLKTSIAAYLRTTDLTKFVYGSGADQVDLLLVAINNARKTAERSHDFAACLKGGYYSVGASGGNWTSGITWWDAGTQVVRKVRNWYLRGSDGVAGGEYGNDTTIRAVEKDTKVRAQAALDYKYLGTQNSSEIVGTYYQDPLLGQNHVVINGQRIAFYPAPTSTQILTVDAYFWWPDYTVNTEDDWFTQHGSEYLMLQGIVEVNKLLNVYVGNMEGNLPPPTKDVDRALEQLISTDEDSTDSSQYLQEL